MKFSAKRITLGDGVKDFLELLEALKIHKDIKKFPVCVVLEIESKIGRANFPVGTKLKVWPKNLRDLQRDAKLATASYGDEVVTIFVERGLEFRKKKPDPSKPVPSRGVSIGHRVQRGSRVY